MPQLCIRASSTTVSSFSVLESHRVHVADNIHVHTAYCTSLTNTTEHGALLFFHVLIKALLPSSKLEGYFPLTSLTIPTGFWYIRHGVVSAMARAFLCRSTLGSPLFRKSLDYQAKTGPTVACRSRMPHTRCNLVMGPLSVAQVGLMWDTITYPRLYSI